MKLPEGVLGKLLATGDCWTLWATRADAGDTACAAGAGAVRLCVWRTLTRGLVRTRDGTASPPVCFSTVKG